jgi:hypothetical protein
MSIIYKNLTFKELIDLAPKDKPFQINVESNSHGLGLPKTLWATVVKGTFGTCETVLDTSMCGQDCIGTTNYASTFYWKDYKGKFDLIIDPWDNFSRVHFNEGDLLEDTADTDSPLYKLRTKKWDNMQQDNKCFLQSIKEYFYIWNRDLLDRFRKVGNPERKKTEYSLKEIADKLDIPLEELRIKD